MNGELTCYPWAPPRIEAAQVNCLRHSISLVLNKPKANTFSWQVMAFPSQFLEISGLKPPKLPLNQRLSAKDNKVLASGLYFSDVCFSQSSHDLSLYLKHDIPSRFTHPSYKRKKRERITLLLL